MSENKTPCSMTRTGYCECGDVDSCSRCSLFNEWAISIIHDKKSPYSDASDAEINRQLANNTQLECEISFDGKCICESNDDCKECPVYGKWLYEEYRSIGEEHNND